MSDTAVLMATYNGERYLAEQLDSIINQTYKDVVCYIHDDGSKDNTLAIIEKYQREYPDKIVLIQHGSTGGACSNFLYLMKYALNNIDSEYFLFSDQDDVWSPEKIEIEVNEAKKESEAHPNSPVLIYCDQKIVDGGLNIIAESGMQFSKRKKDADSFENLIFENCAPGCVMCFNRNLLEKGTKIKNIADINMHDWWMVLIARTMGVVKFVPQSLMLYRQHGDNTLGADSKNYWQKMKRYLLEPVKSVKGKRNAVLKCKQQIRELSLNGFGGKYKNEISDFLGMCKKNKLYRMKYCLEQHYVSINNWFTLLFM